MDLYASLNVVDFGIPELEVVRNWWIERKCFRNRINKMVRRSMMRVLGEATRISEAGRVLASKAGRGSSGTISPVQSR
jgi:hypothetical protein